MLTKRLSLQVIQPLYKIDFSSHCFFSSRFLTMKARKYKFLENVDAINAMSRNRTNQQRNAFAQSPSLTTSREILVLLPSLLFSQPKEKYYWSVCSSHKQIEKYYWSVCSSHNQKKNTIDQSALLTTKRKILLVSLLFSQPTEKYYWSVCSTQNQQSNTIG